MTSERTRDSIIAVGFAAIMLGAVWTWQVQVGNDLPQIRTMDLFTADDDESPARSSAIDHAVKIPPRATHRAKPVNSPATWLSDEDYPVQAARNAWSGTAGFTLVVGASGLVEACSITTSSEHDILDEATCANLKQNARFDPARDEAGVPVRDLYTGRITWRLPE